MNMNYEIFNRLKEESNNIINKGWIECPTFNTGNVGLLFERLLGLNNHNFSIPDYETVEIKTKIRNSIPKICLFNANPDSHLYPIKRLHEIYGYPDQTNKNFKVFNLSFYANKRVYINKNIYAKIFVDKRNKQIVLNFYDNNDIVIDTETSWTFSLLEEKLNIKLKYLFLIFAERKKFKNKSYCRYLQYYFFNYKGFSSFLTAIEKGYVRVTFKIGVFKSGKRLGQIHDHGTSFDLDVNHILEMFTLLEI